MATKISIEERSWNETPQSIRENISAVFPGIDNFYTIGEGFLAFVPGVAKKFQQVMLFPVKFKDSGESDLIGYYPIRDNYIQHFGVMEYYPVKEAGEIFKTKRGFVKIVKVNGTFAYQFTKVVNRIIDDGE